MKLCIKQNRRPRSSDNRYFLPLWDQDFCLAGDGWFRQVSKPSDVPNLVEFARVTCLAWGVRRADLRFPAFKRQEARGFH